MKVRTHSETERSRIPTSVHNEFKVDQRCTSLVNLTSKIETFLKIEKYRKTYPESSKLPEI
jgi:hypothetical protein